MDIPHDDLFAAIDELKRARNAIILAHYYQEGDIQDVADYVGDSLGLSRQAAETDADVIVFAGVHFMAETAKILNPDKIVVLPDLEAGCSLADACPPDRFQAFKDAHPGHKVVSYINCSAAVKAMSDVICTSSNAADVVRLFPDGEKIIFAPDRNLGAYVQRETGRDLVLWPGTCQVHEIFSEKKLVQLKVRHPGAAVIAHPECEPHILRHADHIGSTSQLLSFVVEDPRDTFIVVTESGILHQMQKAAPNKNLIAAPPEGNCACNECPHMRRNTLEKLYLALLNLKPAIEVPEEVRVAALKPLTRMLARDLAAA
ncbi:MAG: quinolinate synthase NadA [Myxococcales bacterium]|nr:quinolinate synthase NadA [Myxococcales bacterium]MCB9540774.1 quinolinate synthase NadA [Myxococcales bacterium]